MPDSIAKVTVVRHADERAQFQILHAGLLFHLAKRRDAYVLARFLMPFREVPHIISLYQKKVASLVHCQSARGIHLLEFGAEALIGLVSVARRDVYLRKRFGHLEHTGKCTYVQMIPRVKDHGVRICKRFVVRLTYHYTSVIEIYFMHTDFYLGANLEKKHIFAQNFSV